MAMPAREHSIEPTALQQDEEKAKAAVFAMDPREKTVICARLPPGRWEAMTWVERLVFLKSGGASETEGGFEDATEGSRDRAPPDGRHDRRTAWEDAQ